MAKKFKHKGTSTPPAPLKPRVERAAAEGRFQQALDLAKQLFKQEPTPAHRELLLNSYLGRARQLRAAGATRDAATTLEAALAYAGNDPQWLQRFAEEFAAAGATKQSLTLLQKLPDNAQNPRLYARLADEAVRQKSSGQDLPEALRAPCALVLKAFREAEAGQDEAARATLQGVGLQSPFLEWKLLLRGLMAYYAHDDAKALENWQRLDPERLPARLAAPLRYQIDTAYRAAQSPEAQAALLKRADKLTDGGLVVPLRALQKFLANENHSAQVFQYAAGARALLHKEAPPFVPRLASVVYWYVILHGQPEDVRRYAQTFGPPADDPSLDRLSALLYEQMHQLDKAHGHWQRFEKFVASSPQVWPADVANRARALVWNRMGQNAAAAPDDELLKMLPPFLRDHPSRPKPLTPGPEQCFSQAAALVTDDPGPHEELFHFYLQRKKEAEALRAGTRLLELFPQNVPVLTEMGDLYFHQEKYAEALAHYQRAHQANPLDRKLRQKVGSAHLFLARSFTEAGRFDEARAAFQASLAQADRDKATALCKWAACEFKAGDPDKAEELIRKALGEEGGRLAVAFGMVIEIIRLKLPGKLKTRFNKEFNDALAEPTTPAAAVAIAETASAHRRASVTYHGQKTHEKKVLTYLDKAVNQDFTEGQLRQLCEALVHLEAKRLRLRYIDRGALRFPNSPYFPLYKVDYYMDQGPYGASPFQIKMLLDQATHLAQGLPPGDEKTELLDRIGDFQKFFQTTGMLASLGMFGGLDGLGDILGSMFGEDDDGDYDEDEDY